MSMTTYGVMTADGKVLFKGYYTQQEAQDMCDSLNTRLDCRVIRVKTVIEYSEIQEVCYEMVQLGNDVYVAC